MKDENNAMIIKIPQMILIHLANHFTLVDWTKSKIAHRVLVTIDKILIPKRIVITHPNRAPTLWIVLSTATVMMIDPSMASS
jgi:hypothetical protein